MQQEEKKLSLDEIHAELLEQLRDITAVCKKHNISYNMMCGSLLGAVRHKGFIPWDDDVDLLMTREEFDKWSAEAREKRDACIAGKLPLEDFVAWLDSDKQR